MIPDDEDDDGGGSVEQFAILGQVEYHEQDIEGVEECERGEEVLQPPVGVAHILRHDEGIDEGGGKAERIDLKHGGSATPLY